MKKFEELMVEFKERSEALEETKTQLVKAITDMVEKGELSKMDAIAELTANKLLGLSPWVEVPEFAYNFDIDKYRTVYYEELLEPEDFGDHEYARVPELEHEDAVDQIWEIIREKKVIGCIYDW